jgi:hypothetical protein
MKCFKDENHLHADMDSIKGKYIVYIPNDPVFPMQCEFKPAAEGRVGASDTRGHGGVRGLLNVSNGL